MNPPVKSSVSPTRLGEALAEEAGPLALREYCSRLSIFGGQTPTQTAPLSLAAIGLFMVLLSSHHAAIRPTFPHALASSYILLTCVK